MRREWGRNWWWWQLVPVYAVQHFLLVGLALPSFALRCCCGGSGSSRSAWGCLSSCASSSSSSSSSFSSSSGSRRGLLLPSFGTLFGGFLSSSLREIGGRGSSTASSSSSSSSSLLAWHPLFDSLAVAAALSGLLLAHAADSQLHAFVSAREEDRKRGKPATLLDTGVWGLSRHPNYLGETVFHASLALLAVSGRYFSSSSSSGGARRKYPSWVFLWPLAGAALNTACLLAVTRMTEARTAGAKGRRRAWEAYCSRVPCWVPRAGPLVRALKKGVAAAIAAAAFGRAENGERRRRRGRR